LAASLRRRQTMHRPSLAMGTYGQIGQQDVAADRLILLGLEGVLEYIRRARVAIEKRDPGAKAQAMDQAYQIVQHLLVSIDHEHGGEIAENLDSLYRFLLLKLAHANIFDDLAALEECRPVVQDLREAWAELLNPPGDHS